MGDNHLKPGTRIKTVLKQEAVIRRFLGEGGQGEVYEVDYGGKPMALKWYKPGGTGSNPDAFYENLMRNVTHKAPSREFLWQQDVTEKYGDTYGYIMELRPDGYYELSDFMTADQHFSSFKTAVDAALHIVTAFRKLHNMGYSYLDLNNGNFFINPQTGAVLICDNDNVAPNKTNVGVLGKPRYMAPEIVVGNGSVLPDSLSDRFSMSVIIFIIICMQHPLEGRRSSVVALTPKIQEKLYGSQPLFIMDPNDRSNAPDPSIHKNVLRVWPYLPTYLKNFFIDAFSQKAFKNPNARPTELDWIKVLTRFRGDIVRCSCGNDVFLQEGKPPKCDGCGRMLRIPCWLSTKDYDIPAVPGALIFRCQLGVCDAENALDTAGSVIASRNDPSVLGIRNLGTQAWNVTFKDGKTRYLKSREVIALQPGTTFRINDAVINVK